MTRETGNIIIYLYFQNFDRIVNLNAASIDAHSCMSRAMECLGHGAESVVQIPLDQQTGSINIDALEEQLRHDTRGGSNYIPIKVPDPRKLMRPSTTVEEHSKQHSHDS